MKPRKRKPNRRYHTGLYESKKAGVCSYRSSWELEYMKYLDSNDDVVSYEYEKLKIPYISNLKTKKIRYYMPDFCIAYLDGTKKIVEIKPSRRMMQDKIQKKFNAAKTWCAENSMEFVVVTEIELKAMSIIK